MIYSNQGYAIVGAMLEKLTGTPWETLITERLFKPLHMDSAGFGPPGTIGAVDQPWGHTRKLSITVRLAGGQSAGHCACWPCPLFTRRSCPLYDFSHATRPEQAAS